MSQILNKPKFHHDCPNCNFLGTIEVPAHLKPGKENVMDLYHCEQGGFSPTVIGRFGSDGPDYMSGLGSAQYSLREVVYEHKMGGNEISVESALQEVIDKVNHMTSYVISMAALRAFKEGHLKEKDLILS